MCQSLHQSRCGHYKRVLFTGCWVLCDHRLFMPHRRHRPGTMKVILACALLALMCCSVAQAEPPSVAEVLEKNGFSLFVALLKRVGAYDEAKKQREITVLAPTDQAIKEFLASMGMTTEDAVARPGMLDSLLSYHIIPFIKGTGQNLKVGVPVTAGTGNPKNTVSVTKGKDGSIIVEDMQGNKAKVVKPNLDAGKGVVHGIDRVLLNGKVFTTLDKALAFNKQWSTLTDAAVKSGFASALKDPKTSVTLLAPNDASFKAVPGISSLPKDTVVALLRYHALPGYKELQDFKSGSSLPTLNTGNQVKVDVKKGTTVDKRTKATVEVINSVKFTPEAGSPGKPVFIAYPNTWAGKSIIHGVDGVLLPKGAPVAVAEKGPATQGRKLLVRGVGNNRSYNSWGPSGSATNLQYQQSLATTATQNAIRDAASGYAPAGYATTVGSVTADAVGSSGSSSCWDTCWNCGRYCG